MQVIKTDTDIILQQNSLDLNYNTDVIYFDIETTGLSADFSYVYLIGCCFYQNNKYHLIQWFSDNYTEEEELLTAFFEFIQPFRVLVHYNGTGFDLPFLQKKCAHYGLNYDFNFIESLDIYKKIVPLKNILPVANLKLKTMEQFIGINRTDRLSGKELIDLYIHYTASRSFELKGGTHTPLPSFSKKSGLPLLGSSSSNKDLSLLLLHNREDILALPSLLSLLTYLSLMQLEGTLAASDVSEDYQCFTLTLKDPVPVPITVNIPLLCNADQTTNLTLSVNKTTACIQVPFFHLSLKYFFEDYKNYYYLPIEDTAVHKSIGEYVEKQYRKKATRETCYIKKEGIFFIQKEKKRTPYFSETFKDKLTYFEPSSDFLSNPQQVQTYLKELIDFHFS